MQLQDPQQRDARPRSSSLASLHQRAAKATCGLIRRPSQRDPTHPSPTSPTSPAAPTAQIQTTMPSQPQQVTPASPQDDHLPSSPTTGLPKRRTSLRERFWSVSSANAFKEDDRARRAAQAYTPRHAATDFTAQMTAPAPTSPSHRQQQDHDIDEAAAENDYALFVERSEMLREADEAAAARGGLLAGRTRSQKRRSFGRRIAEYVKPPREER